MAVEVGLEGDAAVAEAKGEDRPAGGEAVG